MMAIGKTKEEALDALKEMLWREVWKDCVELEGVVFVETECGVMAVLWELPSVSEQ